MKTTLTLLLGACATMASAQLVNGGFEDGLNGWQEYVYQHDEIIDPISLSTDVPFGGGAHSLAIPMPSLELATEHGVVQPIDPVPPGTSILFGGWMKSDYSAPWYASPSIALCILDSSGYATPLAPTLIHESGNVWGYQQVSVLVSSAPPNGSVLCVRLESGANVAELPFSSLFDEVVIQVDASTDYLDLVLQNQPQSRPNPATDKLWVDLPEVPVSVIAIDVSGRSHAIQNFQHISRTLELDVSALPSGVNVLRITTRSGNHTVRFIKA